MKELERRNEFVVVSGYINESPIYESVGGYAGCRRHAERLIVENPKRPVFIAMIVDSWRGER